MILAAGMSSRMKQSSADNLNPSQIKQANSRPKCMIEIGSKKQPFLIYLLDNAQKSGCDEVCLVLNKKDQFTESYFNQHELLGIKIRYVYQAIPEERNKPLGTADAVLQGINGCPKWRDSSFIVCNSDNLYSVNVFKLLLESLADNAMIDYDFSALGVEENRIHSFSVIQKAGDGRLINIIEKPDALEVESSQDVHGTGDAQHFRLPQLLAESLPGQITGWRIQADRKGRSRDLEQRFLYSHSRLGRRGLQGGQVCHRPD